MLILFKENKIVKKKVKQIQKSSILLLYNIFFSFFIKILNLIIFTKCEKISSMLKLWTSNVLFIEMCKIYILYIIYIKMDND